MPVTHPHQTIQSPRLTIRRLTAADTQSFFAIFSDAEVTRYWGSPRLENFAAAEEKIAIILSHYEAGDLYQFGIIRNSDEQMIGTCTLYQIHTQNRRAEVGYALGRPFWGNGYMTEAMHALVNYAFSEMNLHRLEADIDPRNESSAKSLERLGFVREGLLRERWIVGGEVSDSALYGLLASEWRGRAV